MQRLTVSMQRSFVYVICPCNTEQCQAHALPCYSYSLQSLTSLCSATLDLSIVCAAASLARIQNYVA